MGYVCFPLQVSPPPSNIFAAWRLVLVAIYYICMGVLLIVDKYFLSPDLYLWTSAFKIAANGPTSCSHSCVIPFSIVPGFVCVTKDIW